MEENRWLSLSQEDKNIIKCPNCRDDFELSAFLDHHPSFCPNCTSECVFLDWKDRKIQIVIDNAPNVLVRMIRLMQVELDELEYVELIGCIETILEKFEKK